MSDDRGTRIDIMHLLEQIGFYDVTKNPWPFCYRFMYVRIGFAIGATIGILHLFYRLQGLEPSYELFWLGFFLAYIPYVGAIPTSIIVIVLVLSGTAMEILPVDPLIRCNPYDIMTKYKPGCEGVELQSNALDFTSKHHTIVV